MIGVSYESVLRYVLSELGYFSNNIDKVHSKYSNMPKKEYNKLVYRVLKGYNRYFKPAIQDRVVVTEGVGNTYVGKYTYYVDGIKDEVSLVLSYEQ